MAALQEYDVAHYSDSHNSSLHSMILYYMQKLTGCLWGLRRVTWQSRSPREDIVITRESGASGTWDWQQEFSTAHVTSEQTVLKSRTKPHVKKSNQHFYWGGNRAQAPFATRWNKHESKLLFLPYFRLTEKGQLLLSSFKASLKRIWMTETFLSV